MTLIGSKYGPADIPLPFPFPQLDLATDLLSAVRPEVEIGKQVRAIWPQACSQSHGQGSHG